MGKRWELLGRKLATHHSLQFGEICMNKGWTTKPTAKSVKARLVSKMCSGKRSESVLQIAVMTAAFPKSDARHIGALIAQMKKPMDDSVIAALSDSSNSLLCSLRFMFSRHSEFEMRSTKIPRENSTWEGYNLPLCSDSQDVTDDKNWIIFPDWNTHFQFVAKVRAQWFLICSCCVTRNWQLKLHQ